MFSEFHLLAGVAWQLLYSTVELSENILQNLFHNLTPQTVIHPITGIFCFAVWNLNAYVTAKKLAHFAFRLHPRLLSALLSTIRCSDELYRSITNTMGHLSTSLAAFFQTRIRFEDTQRFSSICNVTMHERSEFV